MIALQKVCSKCSCNMHVRKSKCSFGYTIATKSSESRKNHIPECQACKRALESVDQSQECRMADSKRHAYRKVLETPEGT